MSENKNIEKHKASFIFEGNISVKAAIESKHRIVYELIVDEKKHDKDTSYIIALAHKNQIPVYKKRREEIDEIACGTTHGGVIAKVGEREYQTLNFDHHFIALVEGIEDPFNFAHVIRSLYAAGCKTVIMSTRNWNTASDVLAKTSAGASERINMVVSDELEYILNILKKQGYQIVCGNRKDAISLYEHKFQLKTVICIGGEMRGLSKKVSEYSDVNVFIPYLSDFKNALTSVSATSVMAFEYVRQIKGK